MAINDVAKVLLVSGWVLLLAGWLVPDSQCIIMSLLAFIISGGLQVADFLLGWDK
jgi:hypothetical protein